MGVGGRRKENDHRTGPAAKQEALLAIARVAGDATLAIAGGGHRWWRSLQNSNGLLTSDACPELKDVRKKISRKEV